MELIKKKSTSLKSKKPSEQVQESKVLKPKESSPNLEKELQNLKVQMNQLFLMNEEHFKLEVLARLESLREGVNQLGSILSEQEDSEEEEEEDEEDDEDEE